MAQLPPIGGPNPGLNPSLPSLPQPPAGGAPDLSSLLGGGAPGLGQAPTGQPPLTPPPGPGIGGNLNIPGA